MLELDKICYGKSPALLKKNPNYSILDISKYEVTAGMRNIQDIVATIYSGADGGLVSSGKPVYFEMYNLDVQSRTTNYMSYDFEGENKVLRYKKNIEPVGVNSAFSRDYIARIFHDSIVFGRASTFFSFAPKFIGSTRRIPIPIYSNAHYGGLFSAEFEDVTVAGIDSVSGMCMGGNRKSSEANFNNDISIGSLPGFLGGVLPRKYETDKLAVPTLYEATTYSKFIPVFWPEQIAGLSSVGMTTAMYQDMDIHDLLLGRFPKGVGDERVTLGYFLVSKLKNKVGSDIVEAVEAFIESDESVLDRIALLAKSPYPGEGSQAMYEIYVDLLCESISQLMGGSN